LRTEGDGIVDDVADDLGERAVEAANGDAGGRYRLRRGVEHNARRGAVFAQIEAGHRIEELE
jgi:hypothetical protein